jgi:hypothetical protein
MSQPYLFYSERCPNCKQIIETLKGLNKAGLYKFILIESLPRDQIPKFVTKVPTLYIPDTKDVIVGKDIFGYIAKPTNARKELPTTPAIAQGGATSSFPGEYSPWGFEGNGRLGDTYSMWDNPQQPTKDGSSMWTFLDAPITSQGGEGLKVQPEPNSENTIKSKTGGNSDVASRMEAMTLQREKEFGGVTRK